MKKIITLMILGSSTQAYSVSETHCSSANSKLQMHELVVGEDKKVTWLYDGAEVAASSVALHEQDVLLEEIMIGTRDDATWRHKRTYATTAVVTLPAGEEKELWILCYSQADERLSLETNENEGEG